MKIKFFLSLVIMFFCATGYGQPQIYTEAIVQQMGGVKLGAGSNATAFKMPDGNVLKIYNGGQSTRDYMIKLVNNMAAKYPGFVMPLTAMGQNAAVQAFA